jgi:enediyne core biosynthesis thioesterase
MRSYEYRHVVGLEDTSVVGNVYFVNYFRWQGRCRELFLNDHAPDVLDELRSGLSLVTLRCSCEYMLESFAFDEVVIRMWLTDRRQNRVTLLFEYFRTKDGNEEMVARGEQEIACMRRDEEGLHPAPLPDSFERALRQYVG